MIVADLRRAKSRIGRLHQCGNPRGDRCRCARACCLNIPGVLCQPGEAEAAKTRTCRWPTNAERRGRVRRNCSDQAGAAPTANETRWQTRTPAEGASPAGQISARGRKTTQLRSEVAVRRQAVSANRTRLPRRGSRWEERRICCGDYRDDPRSLGREFDECPNLVKVECRVACRRKFDSAVARCNLHGGAGAALWSAFNRVSNFATSHGTIVFAAAGNAALNLDQIRAFVELPAEASGVIPVIATTNPALFPPTPPARQPCTVVADCLASYSDFGTKLGGLSAPGGDLPGGGCAFSGSPCLPTGFVRGGCSSGLVGTVPPDPSTTFGVGGPPAGTSFGCFGFAGLAQHAWYVQATGTSASTPIAAGVAALVKSANSGLSPAQIRNDHATDCTGYRQGWLQCAFQLRARRC